MTATHTDTVLPKFPATYSCTMVFTSQTTEPQQATTCSTKKNAPEVPYYGYRYYSAELGRWVSRDPVDEIFHVRQHLGGIMQQIIASTFGRDSSKDDSLYGFVGNIPVSHLDVFGLLDVCTTTTWTFRLPGAESWNINGGIIKFSGGAFGRVMQRTCPKCCPSGGFGYKQTTRYSAGGNLELSGFIPTGPVTIMVGGGGSVSYNYETEKDTCNNTWMAQVCFIFEYHISGGVCTAGNIICVGVTGGRNLKICLNPDICTACKNVKLWVKVCHFRWLCYEWTIIDFRSCHNCDSSLPIYLKNVSIAEFY